MTRREGARLGGMVNFGELLINVVIGKEPTVTIGSGQKACSRLLCFTFTARCQMTTGEKAGPNPLV